VPRSDHDLALKSAETALRQGRMPSDGSSRCRGGRAIDFDAASMLGRIYLEQRDFIHAVEWLQRAAEAPPTTPESGPALFYDLASAESAGEDGRALAIFSELQSNSRGYRDVVERIDRMSKTQIRG
jgi:hypothetical protein